MWGNAVGCNDTYRDTPIHASSSTMHTCGYLFLTSDSQTGTHSPVKDCSFASSDSDKMGPTAIQRWKEEIYPDVIAPPTIQMTKISPTCSVIVVYPMVFFHVCLDKIIRKLMWEALPCARHDHLLASNTSMILYVPLRVAWQTGLFSITNMMSQIWTSIFLYLFTGLLRKYFPTHN